MTAIRAGIRIRIHPVKRSLVIGIPKPSPFITGFYLYKLHENGTAGMMHQYDILPGQRAHEQFLELANYL
jgi:hypothetical protein